MVVVNVNFAWEHVAVDPILVFGIIESAVLDHNVDVFANHFTHYGSNLVIVRANVRSVIYEISIWFVSFDRFSVSAIDITVSVKQLSKVLITDVNEAY